jgi:actin-related protein
MAPLPAEFACQTDAPSCLVLDIGSGSIKVGYSNQDLPVLEVPALVGLGDSQKAPSFGHEALDGASLVKPVQRGKVKEPEALYALLEFVLHTKLGLTELKVPVLCVVSPVLPLAAKTRLVETLFEKFKAPAVAMLSSAVAALFSTGETSGLVLEIGDGVAVAVPVFEGFGVPHASFASETAGADVTAALRAGIEQRLKLKLGLVSANAIKEKFAFVAPPGGASEAQPKNKVYYELPDGNVIGIPEELRWECAEQIFHGERSVVQLCVKAFAALDLDMQAELAKNVVVSGGCSTLGNFPARLRQELVAALKPELAKELKVHADIHRKRGAWIGGSMFASLSTFARHTITRQEFDDRRTELSPLVAQKMI